ncbi:MAG: 50S ribosomal protein L3 [Thermodesulfobacteriota bacterium]|nr:50S ribosomal protein L3 [Thermodesulfobacteriota bacterium]
MKKGLIGKKLGMTQIFWDDGSVIPVTAIEAGPCIVIQKKTNELDGYDALQLGFDRVKEKAINKPLKGHFREADKGYFRILKEFKLESSNDYEVGSELKADVFKVGDYVDVVGTTRGRGFAGVVKRYGFRGGRATHGSMFHRAPGSIGASAWPSRVFKGKRMPGHMGNSRQTVQNIMVVGIRPEQNLILLKGSVPSSKSGIVIIKDAIKI